MVQKRSDGSGKSVKHAKPSSPQKPPDKSADGTEGETFNDSAAVKASEDEGPLYKQAIHKVRNLIFRGEFDEQRDKQITEEVVERKLKSEGVTTIGPVQIRRAFLELEYEGLLQIRPKSGTFIRTIDADEVGQLLRTRSILEELFVCTCARNTSPRVNKMLDKARKSNELFEGLADLAASGTDSNYIFSEALKFDMEFHDALAEGAGYPALTKQLSSVRYRLRLAYKYVEFKPETIRAIATDHWAVLEAIRPQEDLNEQSPDIVRCGDVVKARLAIKSHLRNAVDRLGLSRDKITVQEGYATDPILDLPSELSEDNDKHSKAFGVLRTLLELVVAAELAGQKEAYSRLSRPTEILGEMRRIAQKGLEIERGKDDIPPEARVRFINLDMEFHASLAYVSGLLFAQEAISHIWQRMYVDAKRNLGATQMKNVVDEHQAILRDIGYFSQNGNKTSREAILSQVRHHFDEARLRAAKKGERTDLIVSKFLTWFASELSE
jgi:DNA-binding GntR family transcriptional regulator